MQILDIHAAISRQSLYQEICRVAQANGLTDAHVRVIVTRGVRGVRALDPRTCERPSIIVTAYPMPPMLGTDPVTQLMRSLYHAAKRDPHWTVPAEGTHAFDPV